MGLKPKFNLNTVRARLKQGAEVIEKLIISNLSYLGEQALKECRNNANFTDRTGNLRSSMGYVIAKNGKVLFQGGFHNNIGVRIYGESGAETGERLAAELVSNTGDVYTLIVVAGMNYAVYVESKGYNVLTSAERLAERELPGMINNLKKLLK